MPHAKYCKQALLFAIPANLLTAQALCVGQPESADTRLIQPADPIQPGDEVSAAVTGQSSGGMPAATIPAAVPEGTFIPSRTATLARGSRGGWYAVFHPDVSGTALPAMGLLPNASLERVEAIARVAGERATARISGRVYAYRGRNYLLISTVSGVSSSSVPTPAASPAASGDEPVTPSPSAAEAADPSVDELIRELDAPRREPRAIEPAPQDAGVEEGAPSEVGQGDGAVAERGPVGRDGQFLVSRQVRVVRVGGAWAAVFDGDPGQDVPNSPMFLAPCTATEAIEPRAAARGDALIFEISGRVTSYEGRRWILPVLVRPFRLPDVIPMQ